MPAFDLPLEPVALPGEAVRLDPSDEVYPVTAVEQMGVIGPIDYGSATAGSEPTEGGSSIIDIGDELEMNADVLGQFIVNPLSRLEIEVRQQEEQDQRLVTANTVGEITPWTPVNQRVVYVHETLAPHFIIKNRQTWDMDRTLIQYTGFKLVLGDQLSQSQIEQLPGEPAAIPTDTLKQTTGGRA